MWPSYSEKGEKKTHVDYFYIKINPWESAQRDTLKLLKTFILQNLKVKPMKFATFAFDPSPSSVMFSFCTGNYHIYRAKTLLVIWYWWDARLWTSSKKHFYQCLKIPGSKMSLCSSKEPPPFEVNFWDCFLTSLCLNCRSLID